MPAMSKIAAGAATLAACSAFVAPTAVREQPKALRGSSNSSSGRSIAGAGTALGLAGVGMALAARPNGPRAVRAYDASKVGSWLRRYVWARRSAPATPCSSGIPSAPESKLRRERVEATAAGTARSATSTAVAPWS